MNAQQYYEKTVIRHGQGKVVSEFRNHHHLPEIPSEADLALHWLAREKVSGSILDVGCAALRLLASAEPLFSARHGVDIASSPSWDDHPEIRTCLCNLDETNLPFPDNSFDAVTCLMVIEHVFDPFHAVREIRRVCKAQGRLVIGVPNLAGLKRRVELLCGKLPVTSARFSFSENAWDGYHLHNFTQASLDWLLRKEGLSPLRWAAQGRCRWLKARWPSLFGNDLVVLANKATPEPERPFPF